MTELKLSVLIPAHNEQGVIESTVLALYQRLVQESIPHEILVINDNSKDRTEQILQDLQRRIPTVVYANNAPPNGFGFAVRKGLSLFRGDAVCIYMADNSDSPEDLVRYWRKLEEGFDCVFGSRFIPGGKTIDYPRIKWLLNRMGNQLIRALFAIAYNDTTNAFKLYRRDVISGLHPFLSSHFNLTVELPLKAIVRGYSYAVIPNSWHNRKEGASKFKIIEMGSRYLFVIFYCLVEKTTSIRKLQKAEAIRLARQVLRYLWVGAFACCVDLGVFYFLYSQISPLIATTISFCAATISNYLLCYFFVFEKSRISILNQLIRIFLVALVGLGLNSALFEIILRLSSLTPLFAKAAAVPLVMLWNFWGRKNWVFSLPMQSVGT